MLRYSLKRSLGLRFQSTSLHQSKKFGKFWGESSNVNDTNLLEDSTLPFAYKRDTEAFGQLVKNHHQELHEDPEAKVRVVPREDYYNEDVTLSPFRNELGQLPDEDMTAQEARLHPNTIQGRINRNQTKIPDALSKTIYNHILALKFPKVLRYDVAESYIKLNEDKLYTPTKKQHEVTTHIAAFFAQNYTSSHQVLLELFKRKPDFNPDKILDVGYGPAVGMLALNEIMGDEFRPSVKDAVILGHEEMQNMAKLLLSRRVNEYPGNIEDLMKKEPVSTKKSDGEENEPEHEEEDQDFIGEVKTRKIKVRTKLYDFVSTEKKYDLIISQHQLLQDANRFPYEVDENIDVLLKALSPNGVLVLIERGNPLGFENIARARQVMIRPENFETEKGKIPRPYIKGSSVKPSKRLTTNQVDDYEDELLENFEIEELESEDAKFLESPITQGKIDYHVSIIAPCSHHKRCPLQTSNPQYYEYPTGKKLTWCKYTQSLQRPKYLIELKRGKVLSSKWETKGEISPKRAKNGTSNSGRIDSNNYEIANYSYLIAQRSANDIETLTKIEKDRENNHSFDDSLGKVHNDSKYWPRILQQPMKRKGHVTFSACASSGEIEKWTVTKAFGKDHYYDARKANSGDLWGLDAKTKLIARNNQNEDLKEKLQNYEKELIKNAKKAKKLRDKELKDEINVNAGENPEDMIDLYTAKFNSSKKQRQRDRRGGLNLDY